MREKLRRVRVRLVLALGLVAEQRAFAARLHGTAAGVAAAVYRQYKSQTKNEAKIAHLIVPVGFTAFSQTLHIKPAAPAFSSAGFGAQALDELGERSVVRAKDA